MNDILYHDQCALEAEARGTAIKRFHAGLYNAALNETFSDTVVGSHLIRQYLLPLTGGISEWMLASTSGKAGRKSIAAKLLTELDAPTIAFLTLKAIINRGVRPSNTSGHTVTYTGLALFIAGLLHDEMRLRRFDTDFHALSQKIHTDFARRELPRYKREEYMQKVFGRVGWEWSIWSKTEMVHVGGVLIDIFRAVTGDLTVETTSRGGGVKTHLVVSLSEGLRESIEKTSNYCESMMTVNFPMIVEPRPWSPENLTLGGYMSTDTNPYPLIKRPRGTYVAELRERAEAGRLDRVFAGVNAVQETRWSVNRPVLDALQRVYEENVPCGKLPPSDLLKPDPVPAEIDGLNKKVVAVLPVDDPRRKTWDNYMAHCFKVHETNRRTVGARVMAQRAFQLANKFASYDAFYFPHDLDSRGRMYPRPAGLNPQGTDYVKALLQFAEPKTLGTSGVRWLAVHGANCWGEDKCPLEQREQWARDHLHVARSVARDPGADRTWLQADNPAQFLAWCYEWAAAHALPAPEAYQSRLHVDLDATCSGLQHFAAMLRDPVGGRYVNMTASPKRQDVYLAVAVAATRLVGNDLGSDQDALARATLEFGIDRKLTKRSVMVKPYAGTRTSSNQYVWEAIDERLAAGEPLPWPEDDLTTWKVYVAGKVWQAIPSIVVAADEAMRWLSAVSRAVARSQPADKRLEWETPIGLPVWQYKFDVSSRRIATFFDGKRLTPKITEDTDRLDSRQMASSIPPSFVHSLDACHLMMTTSAAKAEGITDFAVVHDSFGVHAADVDRFSRIIREQFVEMYQTDVLGSFFDSAKKYLSEKALASLPPKPTPGSLNLSEVLENPFFFS